jgi:hypothetical protein
MKKSKPTVIAPSTKKSMTTAPTRRTLVKTPRAERKRIIEEDYGHVPIR